MPRPGGFFAAFLQKCPVAECVEEGHKAARRCVQQSGCVLGPSTQLLGMGNPLLDISANVPQAVFDK